MWCDQGRRPQVSHGKNPAPLPVNFLQYLDDIAVEVYQVTSKADRFTDELFGAMRVIQIPTLLQAMRSHLLQSRNLNGLRQCQIEAEPCNSSPGRG